jgi:hypothetical protein
MEHLGCQTRQPLDTKPKASLPTKMPKVITATIPVDSHPNGSPGERATAASSHSSHTFSNWNKVTSQPRCHRENVHNCKAKKVELQVLVVIGDNWKEQQIQEVSSRKDPPIQLEASEALIHLTHPTNVAVGDTHSYHGPPTQSAYNSRRASDALFGWGTVYMDLKSTAEPRLVFRVPMSTAHNQSYRGAHKFNFASKPSHGLQRASTNQTGFTGP